MTRARVNTTGVMPLTIMASRVILSASSTVSRLTFRRPDTAGE